MLRTIEIDTAPAVIAEMMKHGQFHSHQDGRWRYSAYASAGGETVYVDKDPTEQFEGRAQLAKGCAVAAHHEPPMFACVHSDGTRGLTDFCRRREPIIWLTYKVRHEGECQQREWLAKFFGVEI